MNRHRSILALVGGLVTTAGLAACEQHFTTQEAYRVCNQIVGTVPDGQSSAIFDDCVACYEDCGTECASRPTSPVTYACPDDPDAPAGGGGGAGGAGGSASSSSTSGSGSTSSSSSSSASSSTGSSTSASASSSASSGSGGGGGGQ